ncbi:hypothetical protein ABZ297_41700 [Nonomuraea sp. NPDC005983]|uniref:hypothetical protein n=1 Tax=Nonomuraea sp. NPDC005983 TaxID=3155595 RepID=UPI0033A3507F
MPIIVSEEVAAALQPEATVVLAVRSPHPVHDALRSALFDIAALNGGWPAAHDSSGRDGPKYVSGPVPVPGGGLVLLDVGWTPVDLLRTIPALLARSLRAAGISNASVELPPHIGARYAAARERGPAARAWLRGPMSFSPGLGSSVPGNPPPLVSTAGWFLDVAGEWLRERGDPVGVIVSVETPLTWDTIADTAAAVLAAGQPMAVVTGDLTAAGAVARQYGAVPEASITEARPGWDGADVAAAMLAQRQVLRAAADNLVWAGAAAGRSARYLLEPRWVPDGAGDRPDVELLGDLAVPDALWYQILSVGHLDRLGGPPPGAVELPGGRVELTVGDPEQWLPGHPDRPALLTRARDLLAPCLLDPAEAFSLSRERIGLLSRQS